MLYTELSIKTNAAECMLDITSKIQNIIENAEIINGICLVSSLHTTAGITINENADVDVQHDILISLNQIVKNLSEFKHCEGNSTSHVKTILVGNSVQLPITNGCLKLGRWQAIYFCEFDGPKIRNVSISIT